MNERLQHLRLMGCKFSFYKWSKTETLPHGTIRVYDFVTAYIRGPSGIAVRAESVVHTEYAEQTGEPMGETVEDGAGDYSDDSYINRTMAVAIYEAIACGEITADEVFELPGDKQ